MKKFLSLVLALVMTMSLVTVSAGAKDYADADDITYVEAVDVLSALGVLEGDANGFRPTDTLKRSEAAKIICALNLTPKTAATLSADAAPFADVAKSHWAAGYIAEGVDSGILAGVGGNKFAPDAELTGYAYLKMLLVCLGYDATVENMTGPNWTINVAKLAKEVGLTAGNDDFVGSKAVTREEAALYALNTLLAKPVYYPDKGTNITIGDITINASGSEAKGDPDYNQYKDKNYKKLIKDDEEDVADVYGRPAIVWTYKGDTVGTYAKSPIVSYTKATKYKTIVADLKAEGYKESKFDLSKAELALIEDGTENGTLVEIFGTEVTDDNDKITYVVDTVIAVETYIAKVEKLGKDKVKTEDEDERTIETSEGTVAYEAEQIANFDEIYDEVEKGDYVLITKGVNGKIASVEIPETMEGKISGVYSDYIKVDGEKITLSANALSMSADKAEQTIWLDTYGYAIKGEKAAAEESDIVYVVKAYSSSDKYNTTTDYIQVVNAEGEVEELVAADDYSKMEGTLATYTVNKDDEAVLESADADDYIDVDADLTSKIKIGSKYYADEVTFLYVEGAGAKLKVTVKDEAAKFERDEDEPETIYAILDSDGKYITTVIVAGEAQAERVAAEDLVFVKNTKAVGSELDDDDKIQDTYEIYIDGEKETVIATGITEVGFYSYAKDGSTYELDFESAVTVESIAKDKYMTLSNGKADVELAEDAEIYDLSDNDIVTLEDVNDVMVDEDDIYDAVTVYAVYDADDKEVTCIYVI